MRRDQGGVVGKAVWLARAGASRYLQQHLNQHSPPQVQYHDSSVLLSTKAVLHETSQALAPTPYLLAPSRPSTAFQHTTR